MPPATGVIKHIGPQASPTVYLELLESVYGSVKDGDKLLARFMTLLQNQGEKPSNYLYWLQVMLSVTVQRGGISKAERKPKATAHQMSTLVAGVGGAATGKVNPSEKAMACIHKQLAPLKNSVSWRGQADRKEAE